VSEHDDIDILLVEDEPIDAEMTVAALRRGNLVNKLYWARDGVEGLDFIFCRGAFAARDPLHAIKLVLLDLKMPRLGGLEFLEALKTHAETQKIPVVVMTSSKHDSDIAESYRLGANGYVTKPVNFDAFSAAIQNIGTFWLVLNEAPIP
jgi:two-component system response regulator